MTRKWKFGRNENFKHKGKNGERTHDYGLGFRRRHSFVSFRFFFSFLLFAALYLFISSVLFSQVAKVRSTDRVKFPMWMRRLCKNRTQNGMKNISQIHFKWIGAVQLFVYHIRCASSLPSTATLWALQTNLTLLALSKCRWFVYTGECRFYCGSASVFHLRMRLRALHRIACSIQTTIYSLFWACGANGRHSPNVALWVCFFSFFNSRNRSIACILCRVCVAQRENK